MGYKEAIVLQLAFLVKSCNSNGQHIHQSISHLSHLLLAPLHGHTSIMSSAPKLQCYSTAALCTGALCVCHKTSTVSGAWRLIAVAQLIGVLQHKVQLHF